MRIANKIASVAGEAGSGRDYRHFTLIELLMVIAVIMLLAAMLFPLLSKAKELTKSTQCQSNLRQAGIGFTLYINDADYYPPRLYSSGTFGGVSLAAGYPNWAYILCAGGYLPMPSPYIPMAKGILLCPASRSGYKGCAGTTALYSSNYYPSYTYNAWYGAPYSFNPNYTGVALKKPAQIKYPGSTMLLCDGDYISILDVSQRNQTALRHLNRLNLLHVDGHIDNRKEIFTAMTTQEPLLCTGLSE